VRIDGTDCGVIGEIHPGILENWGLSRPVSVFEIDLESLGG
jgi:phenylalanyl-tRNA synthetase beta chain